MRLTSIFLATTLLSTGSALAADLAPRVAEPAAPLYLPYSWAGFYAGAQVGYTFGRDGIRDENLVTGFADYSDSLRARGFVGGLHAGYNYQWNNVVAGVEGDIEASGIRVHNPNWPFGTDDSTRIPVQGSLRLRVGYAWDRFLPYITGGLALADVHTKFQDTGGREDKKSEVLPGFTIGAGLEYAFTDKWSARVEYRYSYFGRITTITSTTDSGWEEHERISDSTVRLAVSYRF